MHAPAAADQLTRGFFAGLGLCAVALAVAGVILPGMPTTVFVLAASYCFSRSSPTLARRLQRHRWLGPILSGWVARGGMPRSAKRRAIGAMWTGILGSCLVLAPRQPLVALATTSLGACGTAAILLLVRTVPEDPSGPA